MMYQFKHPYRFDSSRIEAAYGLTATPYRKGIAETLRDTVDGAPAGRNGAG